MPKKQDDLAVRVHVLRHRIYNLEEKHARNGYPDQRAKLAEEIAEALTEYRELLPEIEAEAEKRKAELRELRAETDRKRQELLRLLGQFPEPVPRNLAGAPLGRDPDFGKVYEYPVAPLRHYNEPTPWAPRIHTEAEAKEFRAMDEPEYWRAG